MTNHRYDKQEIFEWIVKYKVQHDGNSPTYREIREGLNITSSSIVKFYLSSMQKDGLIKVGVANSRGIEIVGGYMEAAIELGIVD